MTWARNAPLKGFIRKQHKECISLKKENRKYKQQMREMYVVLSSFISYSFHDYLVISTVIRTPSKFTRRTPTLKMCSYRKVQIYGEEYMKTERHTLADLATRPETEVQEYVIYQTLETVFYHVSS